MKHLLQFFILFILFTTSTLVYSQNVKLEYGDLNFLKNEKGLRLEFDYDSMVVGEFPTEADYIKQKVAVLNKDEAGSGDKWLIAWESDRIRLFQPAFQKNLNLVIKPISMNTIYDSTTYTLIIQTRFTEPGFYASSLIQKDAIINVVYLFVDSKDHSRVLAKLSCKNITSYLQYDYDKLYEAGPRIAKAYGNAGKLLGLYIMKKK